MLSSDTFRPTPPARPALYARAADGNLFVRVFEAFPDLCSDLEDAETIRRTVVLPAVDAPTGPLDTAALLRAPGVSGTPLGVVIIQGIVAATRPAGPQTALRLHGPGEMIGLASAPVLHARGQVRLALLDDRLTAATRRYPALTNVTLRWALIQAAMGEGLAADVRRPRVEDRLIALFASLAERHGRATPAGRVLELPITHLELGQAIGAARPTVSLALSELREQGRLTQPEPSVWILPHDTPATRPELNGAGPPLRS